METNGNVAFLTRQSGVRILVVMLRNLGYGLSTATVVQKSVIYAIDTMQ